MRSSAAEAFSNACSAAARVSYDFVLFVLVCCVIVSIAATALFALATAVWDCRA